MDLLLTQKGNVAAKLQYLNFSTGTPVGLSYTTFDSVNMKLTVALTGVTAPANTSTCTGY
jgi:hypothetical protein